MKLSVCWIFDHLKADWKKYAIDDIVRLFNTKVGEVDSCVKTVLPLDLYAVAVLISEEDDFCIVSIPEWKESKKRLPKRSGVSIGCWYLVKKENDSIRWATVVDWGCAKDGLLPAVMITSKNEEKGGWKNQIEAEDYLLEIDNKSITNRPDMWGHRGVAREIACLLDVSLKKADLFLADLSVKKEKKNFKATKQIPVNIALHDISTCDRIAVLPVDSVSHTPSYIGMMLRLLRVGTRAHSFFVDTTNYVMHDWGQPLHVFDADAIASKTICATMACGGEQLDMLDDSKITLTSQDIIISDGGKKPLSLAGIMGGRDASVSEKTKNMYIESAHFDPTTIRLSAAHHKVRTEASMRFEKNVPLPANVESILRFVHIMKQAGVKGVCAPAVVSVGKEATPVEVILEHAVLEKRLGTVISSVFVKKILTKLECVVKEKGIDITKKYYVTVPPFRTTKDITRAEDLMEEIGRMYGWDRIVPQLPFFQTHAHMQHEVMRMREIKQFLASSACMHEVENYAFYDNDFLKKLTFCPLDTVSLKNPLSEQRTLLVTSLIPHLLFNIEHNAPHYEELRFFECARVWSLVKEKHPVVKETRITAGIFFHKKIIDFYAGKEQLSRLCALLSLPMKWVKVEDVPWWAHRYQSAELVHNGKKCGYAGMVSQRYMEKIGGGVAFAFEIESDILTSFSVLSKTYIPVSKYQATSFDVTIVTPLNITVEMITNALHTVDERIDSVVLLGVFIKEEWIDKKSITMRCVVKDITKTVSKEDIEFCYQRALKAIGSMGYVG